MDTCACVFAHACSLHYLYHQSKENSGSDVSTSFVTSTSFQNEKKRVACATCLDLVEKSRGGGRRREAVAVTASTCSGLPSPARSRVSAALSRIQRRLRPIAPLPLTLTPRHPFRPRRSHFRISDEFHLHFSIGYSSYARFAELSDSLSVFLMGWGNISFSECLELSILEYKN